MGCLEAVGLAKDEESVPLAPSEPQRSRDRKSKNAFGRNPRTVAPIVQEILKARKEKLVFQYPGGR
jgi:hypothetical protein